MMIVFRHERKGTHVVHHRGLLEALRSHGPVDTQGRRIYDFQFDDVAKEGERILSPDRDMYPDENEKEDAQQEISQRDDQRKGGWLPDLVIQSAYDHPCLSASSNCRIQDLFHFLAMADLRELSHKLIR